MVKFKDLLVGSFFGTSGIDCMSRTIFVKVSKTCALSVWDSISQEARGRLIDKVDLEMVIRETYSAQFVDEQTKNDRKFKVKTDGGLWGIRTQNDLNWKP